MLRIKRSERGSEPDFVLLNQWGHVQERGEREILSLFELTPKAYAPPTRQVGRKLSKGGGG